MSDCKHRYWCHRAPAMWRTCLDCGATLSLGPSNDGPDAMVELRAADIADYMRLEGTFGHVMTVRNWMTRDERFGWDLANQDDTCFADDDAGYQAGWLAFQIAHHDAWHIAHEGGGHVET